jgi:hypothetical protein
LRGGGRLEPGAIVALCNLSRVGSIGGLPDPLAAEPDDIPRLRVPAIFHGDGVPGIDRHFNPH